MEWIADKTLYKAVMFALKICGNDFLFTDKACKKSADYYGIDVQRIYPYVRNAIIETRTKESGGKSWITTVRESGCTETLGVQFWQLAGDMVFICPKCRKISCPYDHNKHFVSRCKCGFADCGQREVIRKKYFNYYFSKEEAKTNN